MIKICVGTDMSTLAERKIINKISWQPIEKYIYILCTGSLSFTRMVINFSTTHEKTIFECSYVENTLNTFEKI